MIRVKFCGLTRTCDIDYANQLLPEYIGFVFAAKSRRYISADEAYTFRARLDTRITPVGVFVNESADHVAALLRQGIIEMAQLHGQEDESYIKRLRTLTHQPILKAFSVKNHEALESADLSSADHILLDHAGGGTGERFNWDLLDSFQRPFFLAGGINMTTIDMVLSTVKPFAVDVSSGIETDGVKDFRKMEQLMRVIRAAP